MKYRMKGDHSATCEAEFVTVGGYGFFAVVPKAYSESSIPIQFVKATLVPSGEFERVHEPVPEVGPIRRERERAVVVDEKCQVDTTDCCGMCRFWHQWDHLKATAEGVCRKSRPDHEGFPSVKRDSWCGEFETPLAPPVKPEEAGRPIEDEIQRRLDDETACESPLPDLLGRAAAEIRRLRKECEQLRSDLDESEADRACSADHRNDRIATLEKVVKALDESRTKLLEENSRLRKQLEAQGQCKMLSQGDDCDCTYCRQSRQISDLRESSATKAAILLALIDEVERLQRQLPPYSPPLTKTTITYRGYAVWIDAGEEMAKLFAENVLGWSEYAFGERMNSDVLWKPIQPLEDPPTVEASKKD